MKKNKLNLTVIAFDEGGTKIIYCPALELYGYGYNATEAEESFKICLQEFINFGADIKKAKK